MDWCVKRHVNIVLKDDAPEPRNSSAGESEGFRGCLKTSLLLPTVL